MGMNIYVVYASDNTFAEMLGVSLTSLYDNNKEAEQIQVYVLDGGISKENKKKIESISIMYGRQTIQWIAAINISHELQLDVSVDRGSLNQYARLFIASSLPPNLHRVLYLDCDTIVNQSLNELWNLNMHKKTVAALMDAFSKWYRMNIDLKSTDIMFNSGVLLINLDRWRDQKIEDKLLSYIKKKKGKIQQADQGVLNAILSKDVYCFDPRFNSVTIYYDFSYQEMLIYRKPPKYYSKRKVKQAVNDPVIIHYTTSFLSQRPWIKGCKHKYVSKWRKYKNIGPWAKEALRQEYKATGLSALTMRIVHLLPRPIMIRIAGIFQAYGRPILYWVDSKF